MNPKVILNEAAPDLFSVSSDVKVADVGADLFIGFQDELGGWSVKVPDDMKPFVRRWAARRDEAIAKAAPEAP